MPLAERIYSDVVHFLRLPRLKFIPITKNEKASPQCGETRSLFEYMLDTQKNGSEIKAQEALFPYLVDCYPGTIRELRINNGGRIDFSVVQDKEQVDIELKHHSVHQANGFGGVLGGLELDLIRHDTHRPEIPLIQVALYTAVEGLAAHPSIFTSHQFIPTYGALPLPQQYEPAARAHLSKWSLLPRYTCLDHPASWGDFHLGPFQAFQSLPGGLVEGRVNYFVGLTTRLL